MNQGTASARFWRALALAGAGLLAGLLQGCSGSEVPCILTGGEWSCQFFSATGTTECTCSRGKSAGAVAGRGTPLYLAASAHLPGASGTNWRSDVEVHSLGDEAAVLTVYKLDHGHGNTSPESRVITVEPGRCLRLADVLDTEFGFEGKAALVLSPTSGRVVVTSRTYNLLGEGNELGLPAGATFGQYIAAVPAKEAIRFGEEGRLIQLEHGTSSTEGFRANLGLVNARPETTEVEVELFTAAGALLGTVTVVLEPNEYRQVDRVFARVTAGDVDDGYAVVRTTTAGGAFFAFASVVDNLTGDPVAIPALRVPGGGPLYIAAAAHLPGVAGTNWRTDVEVHCWGDTPATYAVELLEHGVDNRAPERRELAVEAGRSVRHADILDTLFGFEGSAALRVTATSGRIVVTSRTYNLLGEGNPLGLPAGATFGQFIPAAGPRDAIAYGEEGRLVQLAHDPSGASGFRTNLVLLSASGGPVDVEVDLYASDGTLLGSVTTDLEPYEYRQLNRVFELATPAAVGDGYAVVRTTTPGGALFALASVVDNLTGDPVGMSAPVVRTAAAEAVRGGVEDLLAELEDFTVDALVDRAQSLGVGGLLDAVVAGMPDVASRIGAVLILDYGAGYDPGNGTVQAGAVVADASGLWVTSGGVSGTLTSDQSELTVDGEPPLVDVVTSAWDLVERADGSVAGSVSLTGGPDAASAKSTATLRGELVFDTAICLEYPIAGAIVVRDGDRVVTVTFGPDCNAAISSEVEPSPDSSAYPATVLADSPVGYWRFEEATGTTTARDSSNVAGAQDGTYRGGVTPGQASVHPDLGRAAAFSGSSLSFVDLGNPPALRTTGSVTLEWWQRPDQLDGQRVVIGNGAFQAPEHPEDNIQYQGGTLNGRFEAFHEYDSGANSSTQFASSPLAMAGEWTHVAIVRDAALRSYSLYLDGLLRETVGYAEPPSGDGTHARFATVIGGQFANVDGESLKTRFAFSGVLDEVAVYDRALSPARILAHYHAAVPATR